MIKKLTRIFMLTAIVMLFGCSDSMEEKTNDLLVVRIRRKAMINDLFKSDIKFYQQGQTITMIIPGDKLIKPRTTVETLKAGSILRDVTNIINTYRIEKLNIEWHIVGTSDKISADYANALSQKIEDEMTNQGLKVPLIMSRGLIDKEFKGAYGMQLRNYVKLEFRFLKILV